MPPMLFSLFSSFPTRKTTAHYLYHLSATSMLEIQQRAQVMSPSLPNNPLPKRIARNGFTAEFPSTEVLPPEVSREREPNPSSYDPRDWRKYKVFVSTWNVGGVAPEDEVNLEDWLETKDDLLYDIYVLGFQEVVPLNAKSVLGPEKSGISMKWNSLIGTALNKSLTSSHASKSHHDSKAGEKQKIHPLKDSGLTESIRPEFRCIVSKQMVGILVSVWVRSEIRQYIRHLGISRVGCGIMGCLGNKGAVSVRISLHGTTFCFVCCHLASGGKEGDEVYRNSDAAEIFSRTRFSGGPRRELPRKILDHDRIILLGDLNYRISLPEDKTRCLVQNKDWSTLLENDQLRVEVGDGGAFEGWSEGAITFSPTYKYYPNSDRYYGCFQRNKGEKRRSPAWCDRILWHGKGLYQNLYDRGESKLSDHRPVRAIFTAMVEAPRNPKSLASFLSLSDHHNGFRNHDQLLLDDNLHICGAN